MSDTSFNCVSVSRKALQSNYKFIESRVAPGVKVMAMVKADAYGHDMVLTARAFQDVGCTVFGVAELCEAVTLRKSGIKGQIFVMLGFDPENAAIVVEHGLTPAVFSSGAATALSHAAVEAGKHAGVHIKVDTGMGRLGVMPRDLDGFVRELDALPGISVQGIMSHFPESDVMDSPSTRDGFSVFQQACSSLAGRENFVLHIANSGAVLNFPDTNCDMVRAGISLYGYHPFGRQPENTSDSLRLVPAMTFTTRIIQVKDLPKGAGISYGHTFRAERDMRIAVLPVGYEDGFSRILSNRGEVLIHGRKVPVRGRICMNICMVDITGMDGVQTGDEAVLLGRQGDAVITADDIAEKTGSISYEVLCLFGNNNKRVHRE
ncbi:alanine racemase [Desulfomarina sp.]